MTTHTDSGSSQQGSTLRKLLALYLVTIVLVGGSGVGYTFAHFSDQESTSVSVTAAGNFGTPVAGNTPTPEAGTPTKPPEENESTPTQSEPAFSFAAFCSNAESVTASDITIRSELTKVDEPEEVIVFNWTSSVDIERIVTKAGPDLVVRRPLDPRYGLVVRGHDGMEALPPRSEATPCTDTAASVKFEFEEGGVSPEEEEENESEDEEEENESNKGKHRGQGPPNHASD